MQPPQKALQFKSVPLFFSAAHIFPHPWSISVPASFCLFASYFTNWIHFSVFLAQILLLTQLFDLEACLLAHQWKTELLHDNNISCKKCFFLSPHLAEGKCCYIMISGSWLRKRILYFCLNHNSHSLLWFNFMPGARKCVFYKRVRLQCSMWRFRCGAQVN